MEIIKSIPPKKTKEKKYMFVCKACKMEKEALNYRQTVFVAEYPKDFFVCISPREYCECPVCGTIHQRSLAARMRYLWNKKIKKTI